MIAFTEICLILPELLANNAAFVVYKLPGHDYSELMMIESEDQLKDGWQHDAKFIVSPFDNQNGKAIVSICDAKNVRSSKDFRQAKRLNCSDGYSRQKNCIGFDSYYRYLERLMQDGFADSLKKIVAFKIKRRDFDQPFITDFFANLLESYQNSFVYCLNLPQIGCWLGATPELLLSRSAANYNTCSLAGTKKIDEDWTIKEREEQQIVTNYIQSVLLANRVDSLNIGKVEDRIYGNLKHLFSSITFNYTASVEQIVDGLHPTPAVLGFPKKEALSYIKKNELLERRLYTGFLGPVDEENFHLFVNLRCAELFDNHMDIYSGGGIIPSSNIADEWEETEKKAQTLLSKLPIVD